MKQRSSLWRRDDQDKRTGANERDDGVARTSCLELPTVGNYVDMGFCQDTCIATDDIEGYADLAPVHGRQNCIDAAQQLKRMSSKLLPSRTRCPRTVSHGVGESDNSQFAWPAKKTVRDVSPTRVQFHVDNWPGFGPRRREGERGRGDRPSAFPPDKRDEHDRQLPGGMTTRLSTPLAPAAATAAAYV